MRIGLGLPTAHSVDGRVVVSWARAAEQAGFDSVAVIDRVVAPTHDPLTALAAAGAVTESIELITAVLLGPLRSTALLAAQAATVDQLSGGRLTLGLAVGSRAPDYDTVGVSYHRRGQILDDQVAQLLSVWRSPADFAVPGPAPVTPGGPPLLFGGTSAASVRRAATVGAGWICGRGGPADFRRTADQVRRAWSDAGRDGEPRLLTVINCAIGDTADRNKREFLGRYYGTAPFFESLLRNTPATAGQLSDLVGQFGQLGCDDVLLLPCSADVDHVALYAAACNGSI